ncbi:MAG TPA: serine/threonine-protein kinase [Kofleriaceae bacterium]|jgi:serine/threonine-protein kinase|nr:serine/threonine-protein kinase [Kofleriaceae bacterium]
MVDDPDDGGDTVRGGVSPLATQRDRGRADADLGRAPTGVATPLPRPPAISGTAPDEPGEPSAVALPPPPSPPLPGALHATRADSPQSRHRADSKPPLPDEAARYRFGEVLGEGGMGEVLLAHDEHIGREVAVKRIRGLEPTAEELSRFLREARVQGRLEHPAVVPVHDLAIDRDGRPFFVMKRLTGTTLQELLVRLRTGADDGAGLRRRMLRAFVDVCLAIEFAHSRGIVHRDLKPANIMLGDFGEVYVLDWGVARALTETADPGGPPSGVTPAAADLRLDTGDTLVGTVLGTPAYMAPEQLAGDRAGPAADVYALGCILYEIVAGVPLHTQRSVGEALTQSPARPSARRPDAPPELDAICERATTVDPDARLGSARALGDAVLAYLDGDRDVAARADLARRHIAEARAALAAGEDEAHRSTAMRAAGRALALDPTATEAADLVTHLMLRPPKAVPAAVDRELAAIDAESARHHGRLAALSMLGYLGFVPLLLWTGVRDPVFVVAFSLLAAGSCLQLFVLTRRPDIARRGIYVNACINALLIGLIAQMVSPFIIAPTLATTTLMAYAAHPRLGRMSVMALILGGAVAVPWALELAGALPATYHFNAAGELVLASAVVRFSAVPVQVAFAVLLVGLLGVVGLLSRGLAKRQREATRTVELHAWHLRQVVPSAPR